MLPSPCINVCQMDMPSGLCQGCFRNLDEIADWANADDARRADILAAVARRRLDAQARASELPSQSGA